MTAYEAERLEREVKQTEREVEQMKREFGKMARRLTKGTQRVPFSFPESLQFSCALLQIGLPFLTRMWYINPNATNFGSNHDQACKA